MTTKKITALTLVLAELAAMLACGDSETATLMKLRQTIQLRLKKHPPSTARTLLIHCLTPSTSTKR